MHTSTGSQLHKLK